MYIPFNHKFYKNWWLHYGRSIRSIKNFHHFTKDRFEAAIKWKTRQVKTLLLLKDKSIYPSCVIYEGTCSCEETCIGETIRNTSARLEEYNSPIIKSEPAKHLKNNFYHLFNWVILCNAHQNYKVRRNLKAWYIGLLKPTLNKQKYLEISILVRNGLTWITTIISCYLHFFYDTVNLVIW